MSSPKKPMMFTNEAARNDWDVHHLPLYIDSEEKNEYKQRKT